MPNILMKFQQGVPNAVGIDENRLLSIIATSRKTVRDRHIISIEAEQEVVSALSNGDIADDCE